MKDISLPLFISVLSILFTVFSLSPVSGSRLEEFPKYNLAISFDVDQHMLHGTAHIIIPSNTPMQLFLGNLEITGMIIKNKMEPSKTVLPGKNRTITIPENDQFQEIYISYRAKVINNFDNVIGANSITLLHSWYPEPSVNVHYSVKAHLPKTFSAIMESDRLDVHQKGEVDFSFSIPKTRIHFVAAPFSIQSVKVREGLEVYTFFYAEDDHLAKDYLEKAAYFLKKYEQLIGPYPYNHYAIVENSRPTGYGISTFTLLGQQVIRLPFIKDTSLGHEIVHSWFGNSVEVDDTYGNWSEGLTSYLSDWLYEKEKGKGALYRKNLLNKDKTYTFPDNGIPLKSFISASHNQPLAKSVRSIGYTRGAMLFHELENYIGKERFTRGIQLFYTRFRDKVASWQDIQETFQETSEENLQDFFHARLNNTKVPELLIQDIQTESDNEKFSLHFTLVQQTDIFQPFILSFVVDTPDRIFSFTERITESKQHVTTSLPLPPTQLIIDPGYSVLRSLSEEEKLHTWSDFLAPTQVYLVNTADNHTCMNQLPAMFPDTQYTIVNINDTQSEEIIQNNNIFLNPDSSYSKTLFGKQNHSQEGITIDIRRNPLNGEKSIALFSCESPMELKRLKRKLSRYGKYSYLQFKDGQIRKKSTNSSEMGMQFTIEPPPSGISPTGMRTFQQIISEIEQNDIVYIGEQHTSMSDHLLQFQIIEALHSRGYDISIGLEMFHSSKQQILDRYTLSQENFDERDFLKESGYFESWRYDYRFYKRIIDYAKVHNIDLIALNIDRKIVSSVFRQGNIQSLEVKSASLLPTEMALDLPGYSERLKKTYSYHHHGGHASGGFAGFLRAQAIWDETMAENLTKYKKLNPDRKIIVLAGAQHARKDNGIPPRVSRRIPLRQVTLLPMNNFGGYSQIPADYYIDSQQRELPESGKIGVTLEEIESESAGRLKIIEISSDSKAKEAGIKVEDFLISINSYPVQDLIDVRIAMVTSLPGDEIKLVVNSPGTDTEREITVELIALK